MQTAALWVLCSINSALLILFFGRASITQARARRSEAGSELIVPIGSRIPSLPCRTLTKDGVLGGDKIGVFRPGTVILFVQPRSVASFRLASLWVRLSAEAACEVAWTWAVVGDPPEVERWIADFGLGRCAVYCRAKGPARRWSASVPVAIYVAERGRVGQAGAINDAGTLAHFVAGCPDPQLRDWFIAASSAGRSGAQAPAALG
jgi:hypothetical protein